MQETQSATPRPALPGTGASFWRNALDREGSPRVHRVRGGGTNEVWLTRCSLANGAMVVGAERGWCNLGKLASTRLDELRALMGCAPRAVASIASVEPRAPEETIEPAPPPRRIATPGARVVEMASRRPRTALSRAGQASFRAALFAHYGARCVISGCTALEVLEAAHLLPYAVGKLHDVSNGVPLRADLHKLLDRGLIGVDDQLRVHVHPALRDAGYADIDGRRLLVAEHARPSSFALKFRWNAFLRQFDRAVAAVVSA